MAVGLVNQEGLHRAQLRVPLVIRAHHKDVCIDFIGHGTQVLPKIEFLFHVGDDGLLHLANWAVHGLQCLMHQRNDLVAPGHSDHWDQYHGLRGEPHRVAQGTERHQAAVDGHHDPRLGVEWLAKGAHHQDRDRALVHHDVAGVATEDAGVLGAHDDQVGTQGFGLLHDRGAYLVLVRDLANAHLHVRDEVVLQRQGLQLVHGLKPDVTRSRAPQVFKAPNGCDLT
mmetsp:Transcript_23319/g.40110  ORF Transcript_23319/g.40110 Transcript_23319/m.40110 type:complete len:226 (+) Transcript_23319:1338-2015(+)